MTENLFTGPKKLLIIFYRMSFALQQGGGFLSLNVFSMSRILLQEHVILVIPIFRLVDVHAGVIPGELLARLDALVLRGKL